jgi:hypothetical protein
VVVDPRGISASWLFRHCRNGRKHGSGIGEDWAVGGVARPGRLDEAGRGREMKMSRFLLALVWVGVFWLPVEAGALTCIDMKDFYQWYSEADAVVLVRIVGEERKSLGDQLSKLEALVNRETPLYKLEVLRSWKKNMPESLTLPANQVMFIVDVSYPSVYPKVGDEEILYLGKDGKFKNTIGRCSKRWGYIDPMLWLDRITACGCKVFDVQGSHDAADLVVSARVTRITKKETKTFAEIDASVLWSKFEHDSSKDLRLTVLTEDERRKDCGYPIGQEGERHLLYLRRDRENEYSTDICSGNLGGGQQGYGIRVEFEGSNPNLR